MQSLPPPANLVQACRELLKLSLPFILSSSFSTVQIFIDRVFISAVNADAVAATMPTMGYFWTPIALLQFTVLYATVFVAQYSGAKRPERIGPVVWQALYFAFIAGTAFPAFIPLADAIIEASSHKPEVKHLESVYFTSLSFAALPMLVVAGVNSFFAGRQKSWTVLLINVVGAASNALLAIPLILWNSDNPEKAMAGAGWAAALGSSVSAILGLILFLRPKYRKEFATGLGWHFDRTLFLRLMKYGIPNGSQYAIEAAAFTAFILIIGNIGTAELAATTLTFSVNLLTFLPVMGLGQGVEVLVGQRQGENRPDLSARTTHAGALLATFYMMVIAVLYCVVPIAMIAPFKAEMRPEEWEAVGPMIPILLRYVAAYSLADGANIIYSFGLRGAGDTRFVSLLAIGTSWPLMVLPTYLCAKYGWGIYSAWSFATLWVVALAVGFGLRFLGGRWRTMKVIEPPTLDELLADEAKLAEGEEFSGTAGALVSHPKRNACRAGAELRSPARFPSPDV
jgi:MATE family multidrug resistance protein